MNEYRTILTTLLGKENQYNVMKNIENFYVFKEKWAKWQEDKQVRNSMVILNVVYGHLRSFLR